MMQPQQPYDPPTLGTRVTENRRPGRSAWHALAAFCSAMAIATPALSQKNDRATPSQVVAHSYPIEGPYAPYSDLIPNVTPMNVSGTPFANLPQRPASTISSQSPAYTPASAYHGYPEVRSYAPRETPATAAPRISPSVAEHSARAQTEPGPRPERAALAATPPVAGKKFGARPYLRVGLGRSLFLSPAGSPGVRLDNPSGQPFVNATAGFDLSKYWGIEFALDYVKTGITDPNGAQLGNFLTLAGIGQIRFRYPLYNGRLVPYGLIGGGEGWGYFSSRKNYTFPIGGRGWSPVGVVGAGAEYFIYRNIAMGLEAKGFFPYRVGLSVNHKAQAINADQIAMFFGTRVYFDGPDTGPEGSNVNLPPAKDSDAFRYYVALRGGVALFTDREKLEAEGITIDTVSGPLLSAGFGANFTRYLGGEFDFEYGVSQLRGADDIKITGYPVWTMLAMARVRYPMLEDRFVPYVILGGGLGWAETGDRNEPLTVSGFSSPQQHSFVGAAGVGFDYFVQDDVALTVETRDTFNFQTDVELNGKPLVLDPSFVSLTAGIRLFFL